ncbi:5112_t:CDS:2 [Funneliformis caledonium]|uniref:5112_t:CDS:1 n=2 Tax=Funneliformis TaxID=1117308 RepID=A0A9N9GNH6_9GLOM|nr:1876_t:CDS:2 [Funneliformis mosseae]CAG8614501.1 5112_t:CDS:2 [Funneliformis caledonium]
MEKQTPTPPPQFTTLVGSQLPRLPTDHEKVLDTLENDFKRMDKMFASGEMRVFELDLIRSKQISLAVEHISLENLPDKEMPLGSGITEDSEENFKRNSERFAKKEQDLNNLMANLNNLMGKLEELGQSMKISEPKT